MRKIEFQKNDIVASRVGEKLMLVNRSTGAYYIEKNTFIADKIIASKFSRENSLNIVPLDVYMKKIDRFLNTQSKKVNYDKKVMYIEITNLCNLRCSHCYNNSNSDLKTREISEKMIESLLLSNFPSKQANVILSGGEPLLHTKFVNILRLLRKYSANIYIYTNGIFIMKYIKELQECGANITFSLDGADEESNDPVRGEGTFKSTLTAIEDTLKSGISSEKIAISFTIHKYNVDRVFDMLCLAENLSVKKVFVNAVSALGRNNDEKLSLQVEDLVNLWKCLLKYSKNSSMFIDSDMFWKAEYIKKNIPIPQDCSMCSNVRISVDGDVYPCPQFNDKNILNQNIQENSKIFNDKEHKNILSLVKKNLLLYVRTVYFLYYVMVAAQLKGTRMEFLIFPKLSVTQRHYFLNK